MGFFSSIKKTVSAVVKDAVPIAAGVLTGGASLSVLKPTNILERVDKATGVPVSALANTFTGGGVPSQEVNQIIDSVLPQPLAPQGQSVYSLATPYNPELNKTPSTTTEPNAASIVAPQPSRGMDTKTMLMIGGGVGALALLAVVMSKK